MSGVRGPGRPPLFFLLRLACLFRICNHALDRFLLCFELGEAAFNALDILFDPVE